MRRAGNRAARLCDRPHRPPATLCGFSHKIANRPGRMSRGESPTPSSDSPRALQRGRDGIGHALPTQAADQVQRPRRAGPAPDRGPAPRRGRIAVWAAGSNRTRRGGRKAATPPGPRPVRRWPDESRSRTGASALSPDDILSATQPGSPSGRLSARTVILRPQSMPRQLVIEGLARQLQRLRRLRRAPLGPFQRRDQKRALDLRQLLGQPAALFRRGLARAPWRSASPRSSASAHCPASPAPSAAPPHRA